MSGQHDPRLLFSVSGIKAYHIQHGEEQPLTPSGAQTLSLLMVPTSSPFSDLSNNYGHAETAPEEDFYLHLNLPPELDFPLPATTQIYHQPPNSYLIPRWDLGPESGAFTRIEFPPLGKAPYKVTQEDIDTFETILAQCTAFLERAKPPVSEKGSVKAYNPAEYKPGEGYAAGTGGGMPGQLVLVDEENGSVLGELGDGAAVVEDPKLKHGTKTPVEIEVSADGSRITVQPISEDYLDMARHPAYSKSTMVQNAAAASRLIVTASSHISNMMVTGAETFTQKTKPIAKPLTFTPAAHDRVRKISGFTSGAAGLSSKTVGQVTKISQNFGASLARRGDKRPSIGYDEKGNPYAKDNYKPGLLNKSMIAFNTIMDGIQYSGQRLLSTGGAAATQMVGHRWGAEAGGLAAELSGGVKNVGLVYIDVTGVSRRAVLKSVAKGMVVGRVKGGGEVVVGGGDGGVVPPEFQEKLAGSGSGSKENLPTGTSSGRNTPSLLGYGNGSQPPPSYVSNPGEQTRGQGQQSSEKRWG